MNLPAVLLLALLSTATAASGRHGSTRSQAPPAGPPLAHDGGPVGVMSPGMLDVIESADTVVVYALGERWTAGSARAQFYGRGIIAIEQPDETWRKHARQILSDVVLYQDRKAPYSKVNHSNRSRYAVMFCGADTVTALWLLAEPCVELRDRHGLAARGFPDRVQLNGLVELVHEAFPAEQSIQGMHLMPAVRERYAFVDSLPDLVHGSMQPVWPQDNGVGGPSVFGTVLVQAMVGVDGRVHDTRVIHSVPGLDTAAVASVRRMRFHPALSHGRPVPCWVAIPIKYSTH